MAKKQNNPIIQSAGLTKIFLDFWGHQRVVAVDNLDLEIQQGEVYGLLGPNGSGKSTTIKMLLGLLYPTRGWCRVLGRPPGNVKVNARIGYLPEESYLYPFLNARETLDFYGRLFGLSRPQRRQRTESLLDMVGLASVTRRSIGEYSKGMIRRIGLAQALINDPELLILDEPTAGLDPIGTRQIKDLILELGRRGKTVLLCSHLLADVEDVCDRICILYGGKIQSQGTVQEMLTCHQRTQIISPTLSPEAIAKIEYIIRAEAPMAGDQIEVSTPRERLEEVFLRIVSEAQTAEVETSGAMMGSGVSDFLGASTVQEDDSRAVIEQLVSTDEDYSGEIEMQEKAGIEAGPDLEPVAPDSVRQEVLEGLVDSSAIEPVIVETDSSEPVEKSLTTSSEPEELSGPEDESVDQSVIDNLLQNRKSSESSPAEKKDPDN